MASLVTIDDFRLTTANRSFKARHRVVLHNSIFSTVPSKKQLIIPMHAIVYFTYTVSI